MFLKQSTNSQVVQTPSFVSDTDFKTVQTGLTIANTDVKIIQGGSSTNKNSGGGTHVANGSYSLTFNSTDTATVGRILVSISVSGALPVFFYMTVVEEAVYDMLFGASAIGYIANQPVDVNTIKTQTVTCGAGVTVGAFVGNATAAISVDASGKLLLQATQSGVTIPTVTTVTNQLTAAAIATGVWQDSTAGDFTAASSIGKSLYTSGAVPGASGGLFIAGTNAATVVTTSFTTTFTGNLTGNVGGNVTGSVGSVSGAVGSVTGNVGGNVTGSVGSVGSGGITTSSFGAGAINAAAIADGAIDRATFAADTGLVSVRSNTAQSGASGSITLDASASAVDDFYKNELILITGGTGAGQARTIGGYTGSSKVATVSPNWATNPDNTSTFAILPAGAIAGATAPTATEIRQEIDSNSTQLAAIVADTNELQTDLVNGGRLDLLIDGVKAKTDNLPAAPAATGDCITAAGVRTAIGLASANLDTQLDALPTNAELATALGTADDATLAAIAALSIPTAAQNATAVLTTQMTEGYRASNAAPTLAQAQFELIAHLGESSIAGTTKTLKKVDGSTTAKTYTLNDATTPTAITETT